MSFRQILVASIAILLTISTVFGIQDQRFECNGFTDAKKMVLVK